MKTKIIFAWLLLMNFASFAQISGTVKNAVDHQPIPYVNIWIADENIGTTADEDGKFMLPTPKANHVLIFNALGYENKTVALADLKEVVELTPKAIELGDVLVSSPTNRKELIVDKINFDGSNGAVSTGNSTNPNFYAKYFKYDTLYDNCAYLKNIKILTKSGIDKAKFNVRIYSVGIDGNPNEEIVKENIFGFAKKGKDVCVIELGKLNVVFPGGGLFIALEVLAVEANKYEFKFMLDPAKPRLTEKRFSYEPKLGAMKGDQNDETWIYDRGKWSKLSGKMNINNPLRNIVPSIELTLTN